jgi:hypothetical protein
MQQAPAVELGAAAVGKLEPDPPGSSQKFETTLSTQRRRECFGSISHVSGFFESFGASECGEALA